MVPRRIQIRNFLCYTETCPPVDLTGLGMACLTGENGHGKSALLDAMTWAVWGEARARTDDELVYSGRTDMEVQFEFHVGAVVYQVLRKRRKGTGNSPGRTVLEFQVQSEGVWKPLTGSTTRDTQARIIEAVRLDYDTFRNSAFLVQGRADEFTLKAPGDRKKVLGEILGLGAYDGYEAKARDERRRWEGEARRYEAQIAQFAGDLSREPEYRRQQQETAMELAALEADLTARRERLQLLRGLEQTLSLLRAQAEAAQYDRDQARLRAERAQLELSRQQEIIAGAQAMLARAAEVRARVAELAQARAIESDQTQRLSRLLALQQAEAAARTGIEREAARLEAEATRYEAESTRERATLTKLAGLSIRREAIVARQAELEHEDVHLSSRRQELQAGTNGAGQLQAANKRLREDMNELKRKLTELGEAGAGCPICGSDLGEDGKQRIRDTYEAQGKELAAAYRRNTASREAVEARCDALQVEIKQLETTVTRLRGHVDRGTAELERDEREASEAALRLPELEAQLAAARQTIASGTFAEPDRLRLAEAQREIASAGYDEVAHRSARATVGLLAPFDAEHTSLQLAEEAARRAQEAAAVVAQDLAEWRQTLQGTEQRLAELLEQLASQPDPRDQIGALTAEVSAQEATQGRLRLALGAAEQRLEDCARFRRLHANADRLLTEAKLKQQIYDDLTTAFGRRGVQALIIDSVLPEIEGEANRLLARMSNGRMSLKLDTQRQAQRGTLIETLDISISDELGTRSYELFSGGEAFRINLALRIALSKLLARRAGAPLPTLIIDEGFGTQDAPGRERLLEAMSAVSRDFECLIVITHIDELKEHFERQIRVEKTPTGSVVTVV